MATLEQLEPLKKQLDDFMMDDGEDEEEEDRHADGSGVKSRTFAKLLRDICHVVRKSVGKPDFEGIVAQADQLVNDALTYAKSDEDSGLWEELPSFADSEENPIADSGRSLEGGGTFGRGKLDALLPMLQMLLGERSNALLQSPLLKPPKSWSQTRRPHPLSTRLSRFDKLDMTTMPPVDNSVASMVYTARCEIISEPTCLPIHLNLSPGGQCLVLASMGGWKNRAPVVQYHNLSGTTDSDDFPNSKSVETGLADIAYWTAISESSKLIFAADRDRIKSFAWGSPSGDHKRPLPTHTMRSGPYGGPLAVLEGNRLIRAGSGSVGVWDLNTLPTHGPQGKKRIGSKIDVEETWRDDPEDIEASQGVPASTKIDFENQTLHPSVWCGHPGGAAGTMLCASDSYRMVALDLEYGGKTVARYIGHGGEVTDLSTSVGDPNTFVTACDDGFARVWDVRRPLPVLTCDIGHLDNARCGGLALAHPGGIPTLFTGSTKQEEIRVWDLRARRVVYDLGTGNNAVASLAWDAQRNALYAATECFYVDRMGYHHDYRQAKIKFGGSDNGEDADDGEEEPDDDDDDDDYDEDKCWPQQAFHDENYFGYAFDAGDHHIYRFQFKETPDIRKLPVYGNATMTGGEWY